MSEASQATGAEADVTDDRRERVARKRRAAAAGPIEVALEHSRWRQLGWSLAGLALGALLVYKLGIVGQLVGLVLVAASLIALRGFVLTLINEPGRIRIGADEASLPRGLCRANPLIVPFDRVKHAFFLRRAVPWTRTGPLLVVETDQGAFTYPRDWFRSDSDQRRVAAALNHRLGRLD